ncbi:co-chaperone GroES [Candidatus Campbellbacteria bacterium CG10_big_fil_rev_8_21_14_0_10_35_52]|uniref:Co-chaperonin GroES n=1 Tax=Candidatus Campbellbacteria bacterium CG10_big_fil_rev_8_21_14_0_10_35_52 TaxID=1974527 RepID=A0A2M6WV41_9BACT|nr:MAG: co-chaperone GroES [Candidatus Campbellbacteria bacterium CG10_big_fil_rev_8_21_14_0_10_35_52]
MRKDIKKEKEKEKDILKPLGDRVIIKKISQEDSEVTLKSGIIIPETVDQKQTDKGKIIAIGEGKYDNNGNFIPMSVKKGEKVLFQWGDKIEFEGEEYYIVSEGNILAILK